MNWVRVGLAATIPLVVAIVAAAPLWRRRQWLLGTIAGAGLVFLAALPIAFTEYAELVRLDFECRESGLNCSRRYPSDFTRGAIFAMLAMAQVMILFVIGGRVEERARRKGYDERWR
jgi:hypothetical protein